ncbi:MAG: hypothetical protein M9962_01965 [Oligoflexia bacterium]|nr:hypothetical protein [Oligoflexia bacterium]
MRAYLFHGMGSTPKCWDKVFKKDTKFQTMKYPEESSSWENCIQELQSSISETITTPSAFIGYSMGGRLAISTAIDHYIKDRLTHLILISTGLGFSSDSEKKERETIEEKWLESARTNIDIFWKNWAQSPLFSLNERFKEDKLNEWLEEKKHINFKHLNRDIAILSPRNHIFLEPTLKELLESDIKVLYISGKLDKKYESIGDSLNNKFKNIGFHHHMVENCGHNILWEKPDLLRELIHSFLGE